MLAWRGSLRYRTTPNSSNTLTPFRWHEHDYAFRKRGVFQKKCVKPDTVYFHLVAFFIRSSNDLSFLHIIQASECVLPVQFLALFTLQPESLQYFCSPNFSSLCICPCLLHQR
jgi:hypothetical protein